MFVIVTRDRTTTKKKIFSKTTRTCDVYAGLHTIDQIYPYEHCTFMHKTDINTTNHQIDTKLIIHI